MVERDITKYRKPSKSYKSPITNQKMSNNGTIGKKLKYPTTILTCNRSCGELNMANSKIEVHPTQKPVALMEYLIKTYTNEGETVLDFTMGSGTTCVAAKRLKRNYIGIDISEKYCKISKQRLRQEILL
jgi:site-specific DNA-methyltransferase (adenine-specific)